MRKAILVIGFGLLTGCGTGYAVVKTHKGGGYSAGLNMEKVEAPQSVTFLKSNDTNIAICIVPDEGTVTVSASDTGEKTLRCYDLSQPVID